MEYFSGLLGQFPLFLRIAIIPEHIDLGEHVESDLMRENMRHTALAFENQLDLSIEFIHSSRARFRHRLICINDNTLDGIDSVERIQSYYKLNSSAIRAGNQTMMIFQVLGIDFGYHQRNTLIHSEDAAAIDSSGSALHCPGDEMLTYLTACGKKCYLHRVEGITCQLFEFDLTVVDKQLLAGGFIGGKKMDGCHGEVPLFQNLDKLLSHQTGSPDDSDVIFP